MNDIQYCNSVLGEQLKSLNFSKLVNEPSISASYNMNNYTW